jgi:hypothetical protein
VNATVTKGCSTSREEGSHLSPFAGTAYEREGRSFTRGSSARTHIPLSFQPSSAQPTVGFLESPRTRRQEERQSLALQPQAVLHRFEEGVTGVVRLAARPLSKGKGAIARLERLTSERGKRGLSQRDRAETPFHPEAKKRGVDRSRSRSREWLRRTGVAIVVAEVVGWSFGAKKRAPSTPKGSEAFGDRRLASGRSCESTKGRA